MMTVMKTLTTEQQLVLQRLAAKWGSDDMGHWNAARAFAREGRPVTQIRTMMRGALTDPEIKALLAEAGQPVRD